MSFEKASPHDVLFGHSVAAFAMHSAVNLVEKVVESALSAFSAYVR